MRIVFVQSGLGTGGAEKIISILAKHRIEKDDEVHVIAMHCPENGPYFDHPANVKFHIMDQGAVRKGRFLQWQRLKFLRNTLHEINPDLLISFLTKINVLTLLASIGRNYPLIISERNNPKLQQNNKLWLVANRYLSRFADRIVMLTNTARNKLPSSLKDKSTVIHNPCFLSSDAKFESKFQKRLAAVGRLQNQKGFDVLINTFVYVVKRHPDANLTIYGEGPDRPLLEAQIKELALENHVFLPGVTNRHLEWVAKCDAFVLSSRYEGFANVVAEATSSGVPTVAFDCDFGPREIIDHMKNGMLVPNGNISALSDAIANLLDDESLQAQFTKNAFISRNRFDPEKILSQWDNTIDSTVQNGDISSLLTPIPKRTPG